MNKSIDKLVDHAQSITKASAVQVKTIDNDHIYLICLYYSNKPSVTFIGDLRAKTLKRGA